MATAIQAPADAAGPTSHTLLQPGIDPLEQQAALDKLREPFAANQISKLPKITCGACSKAQWKVCDKHDRARCEGCAGNLTTAHMHLDYVGHAELTGRLLEADPMWQWEPLAFDADGLPKFDHNGGLWIKLTIGGLTRLGYGDAQGKSGPNAVKEAIGDALRNAGMRFGAALDLWSKTDMNRAAADTQALTQEPTREDRLADLYALMQKRWGNIGGLRNVKALVDAEDFHESQVADETGKMRLFGELLVERLTALENPPKQSDQPAGSAPPAQPAASTATPPPARADEASELDKLIAQTRAHWGKPIVLEQVKGAVAKAGLLDHNVQGPDEWGAAWMRFEDLLLNRLDELKNANADGEEAA